MFLLFVCIRPCAVCWTACWLMKTPLRTLPVSSMSSTLCLHVCGPLEGLYSRTMLVCKFMNTVCYKLHIQCDLYFVIHYICDTLSLFFCFVSCQLIDYRSEFSRWWCKEMRAVKFPSQGSVFDYYIDPNTKRFTPWSERTPPFELEPDIPLQVSYEQNTKYRKYGLSYILEGN